ncbi:hypothetical protein [Bacillus sp. AK031]
MSVSTKEMINILRECQIARCLEEQEYSYGVKIIDGGFYWTDGIGTKANLFSLSEEAIHYRWEIEQDYVNFTDAIEAFMDGKKIFCFDTEGELCNQYDPKSEEEEFIAVSEILTYYWSIEI